ncbi:terminase TerL endonuclease subunit [Pseudonocardia sp. WMMC193]|uniref:terminase large subunit n=1 Tax=Pseudonocardia sp. WMMC193 TaxID=2911965 RepID=UPI001F1912A2|nr:terminase TerL endonuclease subunit [Pseudonocardia sp. WMMC193]MCF7550982.1 terminase large subunit [Pseudonocardia sp. WMMC193]
MRTPEPRDFPGAYFDPERVDRVIASLKLLRHTQGRWAGRPLAPDAWQVAYFLAPVFGWVAPDPDLDGLVVRIIRNAFLDVPRKNGKTTLSAGLGLYLAFGDREPGAQVIAAAASRDQARKCYDPAKAIAEKSKALRRSGCHPLHSRIERPRDQCKFEVVASVGDLLHGANPHGAIVDELHVHKNPDVLDAIESGTAARTQPLIVIITTPDDGKPNSVYGAKRRYIEQCATGVISDPRQYGVIFAARESDPPFAETTQRRANPGYGVSVSKSFLDTEATKAKASPANMARYQRLHLGIRTKQASRYITLPEWDRNAGQVREGRLAGRIAYGGLDLSSKLDMTSLCWLFPPSKIGEGWDAVWRFWAPEDQIADLDKRTAGAASGWVKEGLLDVTSGATVDYEAVKIVARADVETFQVKEIGFDPWNATQLTNDLLGEGMPLVEIRQGYATLSPALKEIKRLLATGTAADPLLRHGGNPVARWHMDNLAVVTDPSGNVKPDKKSAADKIDGVSAMTTAMVRAMHHKPPRRSAYSGDGGGLAVV